MRRLSVGDLWFRYAAQEEGWALKGVSLEVGAGELVALSGPSGCGKSTLLSCLNGVIPHLLAGERRGTLSVCGLDPWERSVSELAGRVGTVLQEPEAQIFNLRVEDEVAFGCENLGLPAEEIAARVGRYCDLFVLEPQAATGALSGGQKQRLITASVAAMEREVLLLDEPLANLDVAAGRRLLELLRRLASQGKTVVVAEHRLDLVLPHATRLLWMEEGRVRKDLDQAGALERYRGLFGSHKALPRPAPGRVLLRAERLGVSWPGRPVLRGIDLVVREGERLVLLGENGCGKTTLLRTLAGLLAPREGALWRAPELAEAPFKRVGFVYQDPGYQLFMDSVWREVDLQSEGPENTEFFVRLFGLEALRERHPHSLSEGQKRLVSIAAVGAMRPKVLLLDEPSVGQDACSLARLVAALEEMSARWGMALVAATHDARCAQALGDRFVWIERGGLREEGGADLLAGYFGRLGRRPHGAQAA